MRTLLRTLPIAPLAVAALLGACATGRVPTGEAIARLQAQRDRQPRAAAVHRSLGIALYKAGRYDEARSALADAARLDPRDGTTALYLGLAAEQQNDVAAARAAYTSYLRHGRTRRIRNQLESRLAVLQRKELELAAKQAVANEAQLAQAPGNPRVVAVLPFRFAGADTSLRPLERGFAELVVTDLARSNQLTVVERARLQTLLDELALQRSGATDSTTNVRAGRLLQAGRLVQGSILQVGAEQLRVDAAVVDVPTSRAIGGASDDDQLAALFEMEKRIVLDLFDDLGVTLTVAERRAIEERPTRSLAAFLAYSRGLVAEDAGRFDEASRFYQDALRIDPGFGAAAQRSQASSNIAAGAQVTTAAVEAQVANTPEGQVAAAAVAGAVVPTGAVAAASTGSTAMTVANDVNPTQSGAAVATTTTTTTTTTTPTTPTRDPASEATGNDNPTTRQAKVIIVIPIPRVAPPRP